MVFTLLEDKRAPIITTDLRKKFPKSSIVYITPKNFKTNIELIKGSPTLTSCWLIFVDNRVSIASILEILKYGSKNAVVIYATRDNYNHKHAIAKDMGLDCKIINCINPSESDCISHIIKSLNCTEEEAKHLAVCCNYYLPSIEESLLLLSTFDGIINIGVINAYVPKRNNVTVHSIYYHILGTRKYEVGQLAAFLYNFRFGFHYVTTTLRDMVDGTIEIYQLMLDGLLGVDNVDSYDFGDLKLTRYMISTIVSEVFPNVPLETIVRYKLVLSKIDNIPNLLNIL